MSDQNAILYAAPEPYPPIRVERPNPRYAQMLQANFASAGSELTSITQYTYHSLVLGRSAPEAADALHHISITEMHHLDIFGRLVLLLGGDPRYCSPRQGCPVAWNGNMVTYHASLCEAVQSDISLEPGRHPHLPVPGGGDRGLLYLRDAQPHHPRRTAPHPRLPADSRKLLLTRLHFPEAVLSYSQNPPRKEERHGLPLLQKTHPAQKRLLPALRRAPLRPRRGGRPSGARLHPLRAAAARGRRLRPVRRLPARGNAGRRPARARAAPRL